ncbi:AtpZ/AtpI family protein [Hydrogenimonas urashimensis]|uniref:AtpZ/AtpI family protein n=1 Tax=Hydrogenimonas urashimensis TaxID=2740515 RepID=UPI0019169FE4|nr:AtpZ/AtpI family protein [Hydrogenimonas urashimensis]
MPSEEKRSEESTSQKKPKVRKVVEGAYDLSLGISMVLAVLIGVGLGYWLRKMFGYEWLFWLGVFWGVAAAVLNVYKAYRKQVKSFDELKNDPRYRNYRDFDDEDDA